MFAEEYFVWGFHVETLAWAGVQALHDVRQLGVGHRGEVGALRQILAHQAVGGGDGMHAPGAVAGKTVLIPPLTALFFPPPGLLLQLQQTDFRQFTHFSQIFP